MLIQLFTRLRGDGFVLGVGELLAACQAVRDLDINDQSSVKQTLGLLWCHSIEDKLRFEAIWQAVTATLSDPGEQQASLSVERTAKRHDESQAPASAPKISASQERTPEWSTLPVRAPVNFMLTDDTTDVRTYWPVTRRFMLYTWRYLRRPMPDGPLDILDVHTTVEQAARQGFFLAPIYRRRDRNHAHLVLLIDQGGSMVPFHRFSRDVADTARNESALQQVDVLYFHNVVGEHLFQDPHLTQPVHLNRLLAHCTGNTSMLVVSDAGAARGYQRIKRIRATTRFLIQLKQYTTLIAWLNPMPKERWDGTSAELIAQLVPMFQMDPDGLSHAIDVVRGQPLQHYR